MGGGVSGVGGCLCSSSVLRGASVGGGYVEVGRVVEMVGGGGGPVVVAASDA
jgi:hypothetical protein